jgi:hypothetical protein
MFMREILQSEYLGFEPTAGNSRQKIEVKLTTVAEVATVVRQERTRSGAVDRLRTNFYACFQFPNTVYLPDQSMTRVPPSSMDIYNPNCSHCVAERTRMPRLLPTTAIFCQTRKKPNVGSSRSARTPSSRRDQESPFSGVRHARSTYTVCEIMLSMH